jgi:hypothetical protein
MIVMTMLEKRLAELKEQSMMERTGMTHKVVSLAEGFTTTAYFRSKEAADAKAEEWNMKYNVPFMVFPRIP